MSALRWVGDARVRLTYLEPGAGAKPADSLYRNGRYRCVIRAADGSRRTVFVGAPACLEHAVDSPEAFDDAARAAIAFATDRGASSEDDAEPLDVQVDYETIGGGDRMVVSRSAPRRG